MGDSNMQQNLGIIGVGAKPKVLGRRKALDSWQMLESGQAVFLAWLLTTEGGVFRRSKVFKVNRPGFQSQNHRYFG